MPEKKDNAEGAEDYVDFGLLLPEQQKKSRSFDEAVEAIKRDLKGKIQITRRGDGKLQWFSLKSNRGCPPQLIRILLFLYSRKYYQASSPNDRQNAIKKIYDSKFRRTLIQIINVTGDNDLSDEKYSTHYRTSCRTIRRYFRQFGARGFINDMAKITYYLRMQKRGSCFLQAPCVMISYLLQLFTGENFPPADASRLIRHHFSDEQLDKYLNDLGGDSAAILRILERKIFTCFSTSREPWVVATSSLGNDHFLNGAVESASKGPGLVSRFVVNNFSCLPPSEELKKAYPRLAGYEDWTDIKDPSVIPPGFTRFTKWGEPGEFIPLSEQLDSPDDEERLQKMWDNMLLQPSYDSDAGVYTEAIDSTSSESTFSRGSNLEYCSETTLDTDADDMVDTMDWKDFLSDDDEEEEEESDKDNYESEDEGSSTKGEGDADLHAMVLLGTNSDRSLQPCWLLQNSWGGPCQIVELSTDYLRQSGAYIYFINCLTAH